MLTSCKSQPLCTCRHKSRLPQHGCRSDFYTVSAIFLPIHLLTAQKSPTLPTLRIRGMSLCNAARDTYPCYRDPELMVMSALVPPLPMKSSIAVTHPGTNRNVRCLTFFMMSYTKTTPAEFTYHTGPSCSKLTMSLVNDSLNFKSSDTQIC